MENKRLTLKELTNFAKVTLNCAFVSVEKCIGYNQNFPDAKFALYINYLDGDNLPKARCNAKELLFNTKQDIYNYLSNLKVVRTGAN